MAQKSYQHKGFMFAMLSPYEGFANVDLMFAATFDAELGHIWYLVDARQNVHIVGYERTVPCLTVGWREIMAFYSLEGLHWCLLQYRGDSIFDMMIFDDFMHEISYAKYERRSVIQFGDLVRTQEYFAIFRETISAYKAAGRQLPIKKEIGERLKHFGSDPWILRGPSGEEVECNIIGIQKGKQVKFGKGWPVFCRKHNLKPMDVVKFKFSAGPFRVVDVEIERCSD